MNNCSKSEASFTQRIWDQIQNLWFIHYADLWITTVRFILEFHTPQTNQIKCCEWHWNGVKLILWWVRTYLVVDIFGFIGTWNELDARNWFNSPMCHFDVKLLFFGMIGRHLVYERFVWPTVFRVNNAISRCDGFLLFSIQYHVTFEMCSIFGICF